MATSLILLQYLLIFLLYELSNFGCLSYDERTVGPAIATVETKKDTISIRLQRVTPTVLYKKFSNDIKGEIYSSNLQGTIKDAKTNGYSGLTFDYRNNIYYVIHTEADRDVGNILGFYASGNHEESPGPILLYSGLSPTVKYLAMDWLRDVLYWADPTAKVIMKNTVEPKCLAQSSATAIIDNLSEPLGIAVYPQLKYLFWTDGGASPGIGRSGLNGEPMIKIVREVTSPRAITIDYHKNRLYWISYHNYGCTIESSDLNGRERQILTVVRDSQIFDLDILHNIILMSDVRNNRLYLYNVLERRKGKTVSKDWGGKPLGVKVFSRERQYYIEKPEMNTTTNIKFSMERGSVFLGSTQGIYRMERDYFEQKEKISLVVDRNKSDILTITSDAHTGYLYFYENQLKTVHRFNTLNWTQQSEVVTLAVNKVDDMAVDWITRNLYWSDSGLKQIMVSREDGRYPHRLFYDGVDEPRSIAVHPVKRFLFWCDAGEERPGIERSYLDGSNRTIIVARNRVQRPRALAIDFKDDRLYWTDGMVIHYGKLDGTGQFCLHSSGRSTVRSLMVLQNYIIWTDVMGRLHTSDKENGSRHDNIIETIIKTSFIDLVYHDKSAQPISQNACSIKNGDCEHLCLPSATGRTCACSLGYWKINETRCISGVGDEKFLLFADQRQGAIFQRPLFLNEYYAIPLQGVKQPRDVVYDPVKKFIYWSDVEARTVSKARINGSFQDVVFYHHTYYDYSSITPYTLTLDARSQLLYFVDIYKDLVVAVNLRNKQYAKIIEGNRFVAFQNIKNVALDPTRGMMYISCQHKMISDNKTRLIGAIYSATMTGKNLTAFQIGPGEPKGLVVYEDELIWIDSQKRYVKGKALVNGSVYDLKRITESGQLHDITISDGFIYWTVLSGKPIKRSPLDNLTETETLGWDNFYRVQGIDSYTGETLNETECSIDQFKCRFMCVPTPTGHECVCTAGNLMRRGNCQYFRTQKSVNWKKKFCLTRGVSNGTLVNNGMSRYVPVGYRLEIMCDPGYKIKGKMTADDNRRGYVLCIGEGSWNKRAVCEFALLYQIHGTNKRGYVELTRSTYFLVPPRVKRVNVICIGGGGGGFDSNNKEFKKKDKAGDGQSSSFGDKLISLGGEGGRLGRGGKGGIGTVLFGGEGASANYCYYGGAAGQLTQKKGCYQPSTFCLYCGAGGSRGKGECPLCPLGLEGGCSGPLSSNATKHAGCSYGGGSSGGSGGGGGGAGFSRAYVDVTPGEMVLVTVGKGGAPSYKPAGDGIVVISWNGRIEDFRTDRIMMYEESNYEDNSCL